jgi:hypothetical protein
MVSCLLKTGKRKTKSIIPSDKIENAILMIRGQKVMLDKELTL